MRPRPAGAARRRAPRGQGDQNALGCDSLTFCDQVPAGIVRSSLWSRRSTFRRVAAILSWVCPLTRAARGGGGADFRADRNRATSLSPSRQLRRVCRPRVRSCFLQNSAAGRRQGDRSRPTRGRRRVTESSRVPYGRWTRVRYETSRVTPNHLWAKTDLRKNAVPAAPPQDKTGRPSKAMNPSSQPYQPGELPPVPPAFPGDAAAAS